MMDFLDTFLDTDLLVVSGGGTISDHFEYSTITILDVLDMAANMGIATAMFSQGIGPIKGSQLLRRAANVLPNVGHITIRESLSSLDILRSLGVDERRVSVSGDDAIELAYVLRPVTSGRSIGANFRVSSYSQLSSEQAGQIAAILCDAAAEHQTDILPLPISFHRAESDLRILREALSDGLNWQGLEREHACDPREVIKKVGNCRVVVSGSYHSAVFALSQGIPAVTLAASPYYRSKFTGLANQFGCGCDIVFLDEVGWACQLAQKIDHAWQSADELRPALLYAAQKQIRASENAYRLTRSLFVAGGLGRNGPVGAQCACDRAS
jgi:colanic acid/amylovoran biosynthesis protein